MRTSLRKIGNSRGVLIPARLLAECGITDEIDLHMEGTKIVIEPVRSTRAGWFDNYHAEADIDAWEGWTPEADSGEGGW